MKKILIALFLTLTVLMAADACVAAMTAEEAYFAAKEQDDGGLVGIWKSIGKSVSEGDAGSGLIEHFAVLPAPKDRPEWDYIIIALNECGYIQKPGSTKGFLRKTEHRRVYFTKLIDPADLHSRPVFGPAVCDEGIIDLRGLDYSFPRNQVLIKTPGYILPGTEIAPPKDESWKEILAPSK